MLTKRKQNVSKYLQHAYDYMFKVFKWADIMSCNLKQRSDTVNVQLSGNTGCIVKLLCQIPISTPRHIPNNKHMIISIIKLSHNMCCNYFFTFHIAITEVQK